MMILRTFFVFAFLFFFPYGGAEAHVPVIVEQASLYDIEAVAEPFRSQAFYGTLEGFPHTFEIRAKEPFLLRAEVLAPNIESGKETVSGIIIRETGRQGRVEEVARMLAKDASWESFYEFWGGDSYKRGGVYEAEVEAGVYRIEVSTPDNDAPYVLVIGTEEEWGDIGYFEMIRRIGEVKTFFGKSRVAVVQSPFVFIPLIILLSAGAFILYRVRQKRVIEV